MLTFIAALSLSAPRVVILPGATLHREAIIMSGCDVTRALHAPRNPREWAGIKEQLFWELDRAFQRGDVDAILLPYYGDLEWYLTIEYDAIQWGVTVLHELNLWPRDLWDFCQGR